MNGEVVPLSESQFFSVPVILYGHLYPVIQRWARYSKKVAYYKVLLATKQVSYLKILDTVK